MPLDKHYQQARDGKKMFQRVLSFRADMIEENDQRTVPVVFSSDAWVRMWYGEEKLLHGAENVDLSYFNDRKSPVLIDHWTSSDRQVGVIEAASVDGTKGLATIRFGKGAKAEEYYRDVLDGIRTSLSVGYEIQKWEVDESDKDNPKFTATEWTPREISLVVFPADDNAGVIRAERKKDFMLNDNVPEREDLAMAEQTTAAVPTAVAPTAAAFEIYDRGKTENESSLAMETISNGGTLEDFETALRAKRDLIAKDKSDPPAADVGKDGFRLSDLIHKMIDPDSERGTQQLQEAKDLTSDALKRGHVSQGGGLIIPASRLDGAGLQKRDITTAAASGGHLISENVLGSLFVEALRNNMVMFDLCNVMMGLQGNVSLPSESTVPTAEWKGEIVAAAESSPVFGQITLVPKFLRAYTEISRTLIAQSSIDTESVVRMLLMKEVGLALDKAILTGTGSNDQPSGVDQITSLSTTTYATAIANATLANMVALETALDSANAPEMGRAFVMAPNVRAQYRQVASVGAGGMPAYYDGKLLDMPAFVSKQAADGECYFGAWSEALVGIWEDMEFIINPYSGDTTGTVRITVWTMADLNFLHGGSFSKLKIA